MAWARRWAMKADETLPEQPGDGGKMEQTHIKRSCFLDLFGGYFIQMLLPSSHSKGWILKLFFPDTDFHVSCILWQDAELGPFWTRKIASGISMVSSKCHVMHPSKW